MLCCPLLDDPVATPGAFTSHPLGRVLRGNMPLAHVQLSGGACSLALDENSLSNTQHDHALRGRNSGSELRAWRDAQNKLPQRPVDNDTLDTQQNILSPPWQKWHLMAKQCTRRECATKAATTSSQ